MIKDFNDMEQMNENILAGICGGGKNGANLFLSGVADAAEGVAMCAQVGMFIPWQGYALCAAGGAAAGIIWPH